MTGNCKLFCWIAAAIAGLILWLGIIGGFWGFVIGAVAALLTAPLITLDPTLMWDPLLKGFAAAVLGGMNTPIGAVLGGYLLGIVENLFGAYVSVEFKSAVAFLIIVIVLWFRPVGLFGRKPPRKV